MVAATKGYERQLFYGTPGSTAGSKLLHAVDVDVSSSPTRTDTTDRGDGLSIPIHTEQVVQLNRTVTFTYRYFSDDSDLALLIAAEKTGADVALLVHRANGGEVEFDGDVTLTLNSPGKLAEGMPLEFEGVPSQDSGRKPVFS